MEGLQKKIMTHKVVFLRTKGDSDLAAKADTAEALVQEANVVLEQTKELNKKVAAWVQSHCMADDAVVG